MSIHVSVLTNGGYQTESEFLRHVSAVSLIANRQLYAPRISGGCSSAGRRNMYAEVSGIPLGFGYCQRPDSRRCPVFNSCDSALLVVAVGGLPHRLTHHVNGNGDDQDQGIVLTLGDLHAVRVADPEPFQALSAGAVWLEPRAK